MLPGRFPQAQLHLACSNFAPSKANGEHFAESPGTSTRALQTRKNQHQDVLVRIPACQACGLSRAIVKRSPGTCALSATALSVPRLRTRRRNKTIYRTTFAYARVFCPDIAYFSPTFPPQTQTENAPLRSPVSARKHHFGTRSRLNASPLKARGLALAHRPKRSTLVCRDVKTGRTTSDPFEFSGWGRRIRTLINGTKNRCPALGRYPNMSTSAC